jgi:NADPH-dependent 2,4-dienoyl-CoA reductase/sulfur reductase-like enzyme
MPIREVDVLVVGAGIAGLAVAAELGRDARVLALDRLPAEGGVLGYEHPLVRSLARQAVAAGSSLLLGTTALRWTGDRLLTAGPGGVGWIAARALIIAGGSRPSTQAELGIAGERLAGVLPATVAVHLMEAEVQLGSTVVVIGSGDWASRAAGALYRQRVAVVAVSLPGEAPCDFGQEHWDGWAPVRLDGRNRVESLTIVKGAKERPILCNAVVLGARPRPLRNVDGAVWAGPGVTFIQPAGDRLTADRVEAEARQAARGAWANLAGSSRR